MIRMCWREMELAGAVLPAGCVDEGERVRLVMPRRSQYAWLEQMFPAGEMLAPERWCLWLEADSASFQAGSEEFRRRVGSILHHRGVIANLSLRENLLLPFLYDGDAGRLEEAEARLDGVAGFLGLGSRLHEQAGERSAYTHGIISLGRCLLQRPRIVVAQDVHCGMPPHRLQRFQALFAQAMGELGSGLLYLSTSEHDGTGLAFASSLATRETDAALEAMA